MRGRGAMILMLVLTGPPPAQANALPGQHRSVPDDDHRFKAYPAKPFRGRFVHPDVTSDKDHRDARIRLIEGARRGANFAGHFHMFLFGCGMGCSMPVILNGFTGRTIDFPLGGDRNDELVLHYRIDSRLVRAFWKTDMLDAHRLCRHADFVLVGLRFRRLPADRERVPCPA